MRAFASPRLEGELTTLAGGLRVLTVPAATGSMTALVFVATGSRYETRETAGSAHLLEHLYFSGTDRRPSLHTVATEIDALGCTFNAFTDKEYTGYFVRGAAEFLEPAVELLADLLANARLEREHVERERRVVLSEIRMNADNPRTLARIAADRALYGDSPLGWDVAGFADVVGRAQRADVADFRSRFYRAQRVIVTLAGEVEHAQALELAERFAFPDGGADRPASASYAPVRHLLAVRPTGQASFILCLPAVSYEEPERRMMAARFLSSILGGSMSSRLFRSVREQAGLCYSIRSFLRPYADAGGLYVFANTPPAAAGDAVAAIVAEIEGLAAAGVTDAEVEKAAAMAKGQHVLEREDLGSLARLSAFEVLQRGEASERGSRFALIDSITTAEVSALARELLRRERLRLALVGPPEAERTVRSTRALADAPWCAWE